MLSILIDLSTVATCDMSISIRSSLKHMRLRSICGICSDVLHELSEPCIQGKYAGSLLATGSFQRRQSLPHTYVRCAGIRLSLTYGFSVTVFFNVCRCETAVFTCEGGWLTRSLPVFKKSQRKFLTDTNSYQASTRESSDHSVLVCLRRCI